ncbi:MAG: metallophosphoesterase, partial [Myxococcales bacterium]
MVKRVIWLAAGAAAWLFVVNREIMHWPNEVAKTTVMGVLGAGIFASAWIVGGRVERARWTRAAILVLLGFSIGELHQFWLRRTYLHDASRGQTEVATNLLHPWTTTALMRKHHEVIVDRQIGHLRVVHLTDLHLTDALPWDFYRGIVERTHAEEPDLVFMTGDLLTKKKFLPLLKRWLSLRLHARLGVYAVLGNHEFWAGAANEVRQLLEQADVRVLSGSCERLSQPRFEHVVVCGTERPWGADFVLPSTTTEDLVLALSHTPDNVYA